MKDPDSEIYGTKIKREVTFNKYYEMPNHFLFKDNKLYQQVFKVGQCKKFVVYNYNTIKIIERIYI